MLRPGARILGSLCEFRCDGQVAVILAWVASMRKLFFLLLALIAFAAGATHAQMQSTPTPGNDTGIEGAVTISPVQGGPTRQGTPDSSPLPNITFEVRQGDRVIAAFQTNAQGHFRQPLEPGHYSISRKDWKGAIGFYGPFEVEVSRGRMTSVHWTCDTGIR